MILALQTNEERSYVALWHDSQIISEQSWKAGRDLSTELLTTIDTLRSAAGIELADIHGIVIFQGPGSYTGLRIGFSVANALGYALQIPVAANDGIDWLQTGAIKANSSRHFTVAHPIYGAEAFTTAPIK
jgi:tRNA threonylcarbamoyladenosine biosynthesis protein TsaB